MSLCQANLIVNEQASSIINVIEYWKQLEYHIDTLNSTAKDNTVEINFLRKEIINQLNQRFDELITASNFKINQKKQNILSQISYLRSYQQSSNTQAININQYITNNKPILTSTVNINYNKNKILHFIKDFGQVNDVTIKYKVIPNTNECMQESRYKQEYEHEHYSTYVIDDENQSFTKYVTFNELDISLTEFDAASDNKSKLKALNKLKVNVSGMQRSDFQKIVNSGLVRGLHEILGSNSNDIILQRKSSELLWILNSYAVGTIFNENSIKLLVNIINKNDDNVLTSDALRALTTLSFRKCKQKLLKSNILDSLLSLCGLYRCKVMIFLSKLLSVQSVNNHAINTIDISKILQILCVLLQNKINNSTCRMRLVRIYSLLNKINDDMQLFDGDIVIDGYSFVQKYNKQYFNLLVCGFIRKDINEYVIPNDIASKCAMFSDYGALFVNRILQSAGGSFLIKLLNIGIDSVNNNRQVRVIQLIRKLTAVKDAEPAIQSIIDIGLIPKLLQFLQNDKNINCDLQFEAAWIFTNICSGTNEQTQYIIDTGAIPLLANLITSSSDRIQQQTAWALANIAGHPNENSKNMILNTNVLKHCVPICKNYLKLQNDEEGTNLLRNIAWMFRNLSKREQRPRWKYIEQMIECSFYLLKINNYEILWECGHAFALLTRYITGDDDVLVVTLKNMGFIKIFINLLDNESNEIQEQILASINSILARTTLYDAHAIKCGVLEKLFDLSKTATTSRQKISICNIIANIMANSKRQTEQVIKANIFPLLIDMLQNEEDTIVAGEALWAIANAIDCGTCEQISYLVNLNVISAICAYIKREISDDIRLESLYCLQNVLNKGTSEYKSHIEQCGGLETLQSMQWNGELSDSIHDALFNVLTYWS